MRCCKSPVPYLSSRYLDANGELTSSSQAASRVLTRRCASCGSLHSLGPANDGGEHAAQVAVEIAAARMAAGAAAYEAGDFAVENIVATTNIGGPRSEAARLAREIHDHVIATHGAP